jgi:uncharacterized small protein (DUF1192 family)
MDPEELEPRLRKPPPKNLNEMSIEAIGDYIGELKAEIARAEATIEAKRKIRSGADALFKR